MADLLCIIMTISAAMLLCNMMRLFRMKNMRHETTCNDRDGALRDNHGSKEQHTIELIGEDAFKRMSARIDEILQNNAGRQSVTLDLTCGPDTAEGAETLHELLPGTELMMVSCRETGVEWIDIYAHGRRIGRLTLSEAETVKNIMQNNLIKKAYVAEQNCFGIEDSYQMSIILYFEPRLADDCMPHQNHAQQNMKSKGDNAAINICLN